MKSIIIIGKRWFEKVNGNTYHSCRVLVDGVEIGFQPFVYGYGDHYTQTGFELLKDKNLLPNLEYYPNGNAEQLWQYCQRNNIILNSFVSDVTRKKDLL